VPGGDVSALSLNDIWNLPGHPTIIIDWPGGQGVSCLNLPRPTPMAGFYANQCLADTYCGFVSWWKYDLMPGIKTTLADALSDRKDWKDDPRCKDFTVTHPRKSPTLCKNERLNRRDRPDGINSPH
jgi:hypothetical protein